MKIKIDKQLLGLDDKPIVNGNGPALTLKEVCIGSILTPVQEDTEKGKLDKYDIYKKLKEAKGSVDLTIEELAIIKKCIGKFQPQLIMGQAWEMLEQIAEKELK